MKFPPRWRALALAAVALALTGVGLYDAASSSAPTPVSDSALALHGQPPRTATIAFTITTNQQYDITGTLDVDFQTNEVSGTLLVPQFFSTTTYSAVDANGELDLGVPSLASLLHTPWVSLPGGSLDLSDVAYIMSDTKIDIEDFGALIGTMTTTSHGQFTTYRFVRHESHVVLPKGLPLSLPSSGTVTASVTLAHQGQLAAVSVAISAKTLYLKLSLKVLSYNSPVSIAVPKSSVVKNLTPAMRGLIFGSPNSTLGRLFSPTGIAALTKIGQTTIR